jgi:hypothetical protein
MTEVATSASAMTVGCVALVMVVGSAASSLAWPIRSSMIAPQEEPTRLEAGQPVARTIAAGETHRYRVALKANHALHVVATQLGADIVLALVGADGKPTVEMDTPTGTEGAESVWFVAPSSGDVQIEVRPFEGQAGRYEVRVDAVREATPDDAKRVQLQALFLEANRLGQQRTREAQMAAMDKFKEAVALARSVGERDMAALSVSSLRAIDIGAALESTALTSLPGKVPVYYSPGYESRAAKLRDNLTKAVDFFEQKLSVTPKIYLAVVGKEHWSDASFVQTPYGMPNSSVSRSGAGLVTLPATHEAFDELGRSIKAGLPAAALKELESTGFSFEESVREFGDSIMYHELGHIYSTAYGIAIPNRWVNELLANYLSIAYASEQPANPRLEQFRSVMSAGLLKASKPKHTTLEDFERVYMGVGFQNYGWYQSQITRRAEEVYKTKKLDFMKEVKAAFPPYEKRPVPVDVSLERLETISPGFLDWARQLGGTP